MTDYFHRNIYNACFYAVYMRLYTRSFSLGRLPPMFTAWDRVYRALNDRLPRIQFFLRDVIQ